MMSIDENEVVGTDIVSEAADNADVKEKKQKEKKKAKSYSKKSSDGKTMGLLIAILAVGVCLLGVSVAGMIGVADDFNGGLEAETTTQASADGNQQQNTPVVNTPVTPENTTAADTGADNTTAANQANNGDSTQSRAPSSNEEWLAFFNTAVNKLKTDAPSMTKAKQTKTADIQLSNSLGQAYVSSAKDKFLSDEVVETPIAKGDKAAAQANVSPDGAAYVSNLTMADVKSVSGTTDSNGNYVITIAMNDMTNPGTSSAYAKIFQFMTVDDVMNTYAPDMGATVDRSNVELKFSNCSASATITPDGKVVSYQTTVNANMILKDAKISVITTDLDATLFSETKYSNITW